MGGVLSYLTDEKVGRFLPVAGQCVGALEKEFLLTDADFNNVRQLIYSRAGISLGEGKKEMVYSRLSRRLRALGLTSCSDYLRLLAEQANAPEWEFFTNALTTNLTAFFRENHHFPSLAEHLLRQTSPLVLWSCASSTGEEPYSMAIAACEAFNSMEPPVSILATDVDTQVLKTADAGIYPLDRLSGLTEERLKRYFLRGCGKQSGFVRVRPELRKLISFKPLNLLSNEAYLSKPVDAIFCRNVMIYFDKLTQQKILDRFAPLIKTNGLLFLGHSENLAFVTDRFVLKGKTVYEVNHDLGL